MPSTMPLGLGAETAAARARSTRTLFTGVALGSTGFIGIVTVTPLAAEDIAGARWSGLPITAGIAGVALGASLLSALMTRQGRRPGLVLGYLLGAFGALLAMFAVASSRFLVLLAGMILVGVANSAAQLARYAAADLHPPLRRGSAVAMVVWAGTVGAVLGPNLLPVSGRFASRIALPEAAGPFLFGFFLLALAGLLSAAFLRPDPAAYAGAGDDVPAANTTVVATSAWRMPTVQVAAVVLVSAQTVMILIMTMTPVHIRHSGHGLGTVGLVMSAHVVGMFGLAPVAGRLADRIGALAVILIGAAMLASSGLWAAAAPGDGGLLLSGPLFLLGLGWSFSFVAGSSLLSVGLPFAQRTRVQGLTDTMVWVSAGAASLASGVVLAVAGYSVLALMGAGMVAAPAAVVLLMRGSVRQAQGA